MVKVNSKSFKTIKIKHELITFLRKLFSKHYDTCSRLQAIKLTLKNNIQKHRIQQIA